MSAPAHRAVVVAQGLVERAGDLQVVDLLQSTLDQVAVAAGRGNDPELVGVVGVLARCGADQALGRDADEAGQLGDDAVGKGLQALFGDELVAGGNDLLQPLAAFIQALQLVVGANGRGQRGVQPGVGQFAFGLVVVDVVAGDGVGFRRLARLAGAQDDADVEQHQVLADGLHRLAGRHRRFPSPRRAGSRRCRSRVRSMAMRLAARSRHGSAAGGGQGSRRRTARTRWPRGHRGRHRRSGCASSNPEPIHRPVLRSSSIKRRSSSASCAIAFSYWELMNLPVCC